MTPKFWQLLNWPASQGPFQPKLIMPLATVFVEIFLKEKNWGGFRPYLVTLWKEFDISFKKGVFKIFERVNCPGQSSGSWINVQSFMNVPYIWLTLLDPTYILSAWHPGVHCYHFELRWQLRILLSLFFKNGSNLPSSFLTIYYDVFGSI